MKLSTALLLAPLLLGGCEKVDTLDVDVRSQSDIVIRLTTGRCIDQLQIDTPEIKSTTMWKIVRDQKVNRHCLREVSFPKVPAGFRLVTPADTFPKGSYAIAGTAQDYAIAGNFDVPKRTSIF